MKKAISLVLTVVMLFAVCVPAFAATDISQTHGEGKVNVITETKTDTGEDAETYSVIIPADTKIAWGTISTDVSYSVESHLSRNKAVNVAVTGSGEMTTEDMKYSLPYTLEGVLVYHGSRPVVYPAETQTVNVVITEDSWKNAVVESYSDVLTYESEVIIVTA